MGACTNLSSKPTLNKKKPKQREERPAIKLLPNKLSHKVSVSIGAQYTILMFLTDVEKLQYQLHSKRHQKLVWNSFDISKRVKTTSVKQTEFLHHFALGAQCIMNDNEGRWVKGLQVNTLGKGMDGDQCLNQSVMVSGNRLMVMNQYDQNYFVHIQNQAEMLPQIGVQRLGVGLFYRTGGQYVYSVGGRKSVNKTFSTYATRFDLVNRKWDNLPNMNIERYSPGVYESKDGNSVYAFGWQDTIERLNLQEKGEWQKIHRHPDFQNNGQRAFEYDDKVLIFSFNQSFITFVDDQLNIINKKQNMISGDMIFYSNPIIIKNQMFILGKHHFQSLNLDFKKKSNVIGTGVKALQ